MSSGAPSPYDASGGPAVPWWLGRGVGVLLALAVGAVLWTFGWGLATQVETASPPPVDQQWNGVETALSPVSAGTGRADGQEHGSEESPRSLDEDRDAGTDGEEQAPLTQREPIESESTPARPTDHALQAETMQERRQERIRRAQRSDRELAAFIESVGVLEAIELWVTPLNAAYRITATFGQSGSMWSADHTGVDLAAPSGTPVSSVAAGTVTHAAEAGAYGLRVEVTHSDGTTTSYSHLSRIDVEVGQVVGQGAVIGAVGSTGNSTGPHLHLELRTAGDVPVDPVDALLARGVAL